MSILSPKSKSPPSAADIERQLEPARARVIELEAAIGQAALDAVTGDPDAVQRHAKVKADLLAAHDKLDLLNRAHQGAIERDRADLAARQASLRKTQIESRKRDAAALRKLAEEFATAEATCNHLYQEMLDHAAKLMVPIAGISLPDEGLPTPGRIRVLAGAECFRLSAERSGGSIGRNTLRLLPGCEGFCPPGYEDNIPAITPFAEAVRAEIAAYIGYLKEQAD